MIKTTVKANPICQHVKIKQVKHCACIEQFLNKSLTAFGKELNRIGESMYRYPNGHVGIGNKDSINDVFALIERSNVGVFNNAVVRTFPADDTLQEFTVYKRVNGKDEYFGRADFIVVHKCQHKEYINLLFEAKAAEATSKIFKKAETKEWYNKLHKKAHTYYTAEKIFYTGDTFTVAINFDWIRKPDLLYNELKNNYASDKITDFYFIYHTNEAGLMVYGNVKPVEK